MRKDHQERLGETGLRRLLYRTLKGAIRLKQLTRFFRRTVCLALVLLMVCSCAQAAPGRDVRDLDLRVSQSLKAFVNLMGGACLLRDVRELTENETPPDPLLEGALLLGLSRGLLPRTDGDPNDSEETLPVSSAEQLLSGLFACPGGVRFPQTPGCPCMKRSGDELTVNFEGVEASTSGGARIFSVQKEGSVLTVLADVFTSMASWQTDPLVVSEDCLTWEYTARFVLQEEAGNPDVLFGYRLISLASYPEWGQGCLDEWRSVRKDSFSFILPPYMSRWSETGTWEAGDKEYRFEKDDGSAVLTVREEQARSQDPLSWIRSDYLAAHPDAQVKMEPLLHYASAETLGEYALVVAPGNGTVYTFILSFPMERQYEYSFVGEMIRNSFWCLGVPLG